MGGAKIVTIGLAWVGSRPDGREYLWMASDSRTRGGFVLDCSPKLMPLVRSDSAICFAGDTAAAYPLMMQLSTAVAAHQPARDRSLDITRLKGHLLRVFTDTVDSITDAAEPFVPADAQFLFGGYSWFKREFQLWTIHYDAHQERFLARPAPLMQGRVRAAFIGDHAKYARARLNELLYRDKPEHVYLEPFGALVEMLKEAEAEDSIGGPPQLLRISAHMTTRPLYVRWGPKISLFGRELFDYENTDYWGIDAESLESLPPRKFGAR